MSPRPSVLNIGPEPEDSVAKERPARGDRYRVAGSEVGS